METPLMRDRGVISVACEVFGTDLPICICKPMVWRTVYLAALFPVLEIKVQVEPEVAEIVVQRLRFGVERAKDQALVRVDANGDERPVLALEATFVTNCAAVVSPLRPYTSVRPVNTVAVSDMLALCRDSGGAVFHQISTIGVAFDGTTLEFIESQDLTGYLASKAIAEEIVREAGLAGLPSSIIRLGRVVGPRKAGAVNTEDALWTVLRACAVTGFYPVVDIAEPLSCVDDVTAAIVELALKSPVSGVVRTIGPPSSTRFVDIVRAVGLIDRSHHGVTIQQWQTLIEMSEAIADEHKQLISAWCSMVHSRDIHESDWAAPISADEYFQLPGVSNALLQQLAARDSQFRTQPEPERHAQVPFR
ncbi:MULTISPECIES: SDR family oxidoreductase [unclassified Rhodococcus (in: high G+C Gram-positive bacteria)]|uniref:SDR family oxidoreductase n=2 Tax=unclassified Rhodococcus (in: high G+C Gram-positive bacteria) TaxID=192944 RepID=UPI001140419D